MANLFNLYTSLFLDEMPKNKNRGGKVNVKGDFVTIKFKRCGKTLEILCKEGAVEDFREGKMKMRDALFHDAIFTNSTKGVVATREVIEEVTGQTSEDDALALIMTKGDFQYTTKELAEKREAKRRQIVAHICSTYLNPTTDLPYSDVLVTTTLKKVLSVIDPFRSAIHQWTSVQRKFNDLLVLKERTDVRK